MKTMAQEKEKGRKKGEKNITIYFNTPFNMFEYPKLAWAILDAEGKSPKMKTIPFLFKIK